MTELEIVSSEPQVTAHGQVVVRHWEPLPLTQYGQLAPHGYPRWLGPASAVEQQAAKEKKAKAEREASEQGGFKAYPGETLEEQQLR